MEEQKIVSKEVKMEPAQKQDKAQGNNGSIQEELQEWSKEQLIQQIIKMNQQLYNQDSYIRGLRKQLGDAEQFFSNKKMDYLFKVVEISSNYKWASEYPCFAKGFVEDCIAEIQEALSIPEQEKGEENKEG